MKSLFLDAINSSTSRQRKQDAALLLDYYSGSQLSNLFDILSQDFSDPSKLQLVCVNIVRKIVNSKAMVYMQPPRREIEGSDKDRELFAEIAEQSDLSATMKTASRLVKLTKTCLVRPVWRNNRLDLDILTPDIVDVWTGDSPRDLECVMVTHRATKMEDTTYSMWTSGSWTKLDFRGNQIEAKPNPYGQIPFVFLWDSLPTSDFWISPGDDLTALQEAINSKLVDLLYTLRFQGYGVGWLRGGDGGGNVEASPGAFIELPEGGELGFASPNAPIEDVVGAIDKLLKWACVSNGLSASSMSTDPTEESGLSKIVGNAELMELRQDDLELFRKYEKQLFSMIRIVWNYHNPSRKLSDSAELRVDFADPKPVVSDSEKAESFEKLMMLGVISPVDVVMERNPDLTTREEALEFLLKVQAETKQLENGMEI